MARFAFIRKFCIYAKFAYVCKSGHVYTASDASPLCCDAYKIRVRKLSIRKNASFLGFKQLMIINFALNYCLSSLELQNNDV